MSKVGVSRKSFLGDLLVDRGLISPAQKDEALRISRETSRRLGEILIEMGPVSQEDISKILAEQAGLRFFRLRQGLVDPQIVNILPRDKATMYEVLPLFRIRDKLILAIGDPNKIFVLDTVKKLTGCTIEPVVCPRDDILPMIEKVYGESPNAIEDLVPDFDESDLEYVSLETTAEIEDIAQSAGESPVINLVNQIILKSLKNRASDIHIEPEPKYFRVRYRIDGVLYEIMRQRIEMHAPVVSRLKLMANLDIAERRHPQDGRVQVLALGREVDLRLSTLPGVCGEKAVLRILDKQKGVIDLDQLGFDADTLSAFRSILARPNGLLLVTGPTGSGKTTTLYAGLKTLNSIEKNIVTIEDPVEYQFEIINQNQVKKEIGYTFASILKSTLRQDPDIIMVGEIRDPETAKIAVQAALTGHLVLSTVHTNDAASSISRLLDIGVEPYLLAPSLIGVIGQRLVRTNCPECAEASFPSPAEKKALGITGKSNLRLYRGRGCENCFDSGYHGRVGIFELLVSDDAFQNLLLQQPTLEEIRKFQVSHGLATLRSEGIKLVREGKSTLEEVSRAVSLG